MKKLLLIVSSLFFLTHTALSAVTAKVEQSVVPTGQPFTLIISSDEDISEKPDLSVLNGLFDVVSTSVSHQNYILNGQASSKTTWHFGLIAPTAGKTVIPSIPLGHKKTNPISIEVSDDASFQTAPNESVNNIPHQTKNPLYTLSAELKNVPSHPFIQQQLIYLVTLTDNGRLQGDAPYFDTSDDFIIQKLGNPTTKTTTDGKRLTTFPFALFAQKSGTLKLPTVHFQGMSYEDPDQENFFDGGFFQIRLSSVFGIQTPVHLNHEGKKIEIYPVPTDYKNAWWLPSENVTLTSEFKDKPQVLTTGTPVTREIILKAENLTDTQLPELSFEQTDDFRIYPEKPTSQTYFNNQKLIAEQKTLVTYIPQKSGTLTLPQVSVMWYNTKTNQVSEAVTDEIKLEILPVSTPTNEVQTSAPKAEIKTKNAPTLTPSYFYIGLFLAFVCGILLSLLIIKISKKETQKTPVISKKIPQNDLQELRNSVIFQTQKTYPNRSIKNLGDVAELLNNENLKEQIDALTQALYSPNKNDSFNKKTFLKAFQKALHQKKKSVQDTTPLPPLYLL